MNEGRKVKYTRRVIKESFLNLLMEKPISKITVAEICDLADIHRGTFYQHYHDVYHLLEAIENELYVKFEEMQPTLDNSMNSIVSAAIELINEERSVCRAILGEHGDTQFLQRVWDLCRTGSHIIYSKQGMKPDDFNFVYTYLTSGCIGIIRAWINNGFQEKPKDIMAYIEKLSQFGLSSFIKG